MAKEIVTDFLGNEIRQGDIVLYSERGSRGYSGSFTTGVVVKVAKTLAILDEMRIDRYNDALELFKSKGRCYLTDGKHSNNVVDLTALGKRERIEHDN